MQILKQLFIDSLQAEKHLEIVRSILLDHISINPKLLFLHISNQKQQITIEDLQSLFDNHLIRFTNQELTKLLPKTSHYTQFLNFILPSNYHSLKQLNSFNKIQSNHDDQLFMSSFHIILKIFEQELQIIRKLIAYSQSLIGQSLPTPKSITHVLSLLEITATSDDIVAILRRLDFDADADFKNSDLQILISYSKISNPRSPSNRDTSFTQSIKCVSFTHRNTSQRNIDQPIKQKIPTNKLPQKMNKQSEQSLDQVVNKPLDYQQDQKLNKQLRLEKQISNKENQQPNIQQNNKESVKNNYLENLKQKYTIQRHTEDIETMRQEVNLFIFLIFEQLAMRADFTIQQAIEYFDLNQDGEVDQEDFRIGCLQLGLEVDRMLNFEDIFIPKDQTCKLILQNRKAKPLGFETKRLMKEIIRICSQQ